jgi:hypothetical protein
MSGVFQRLYIIGRCVNNEKCSRFDFTSTKFSRFLFRFYLFFPCEKRISGFIYLENGCCVGPSCEASPSTWHPCRLLLNTTSSPPDHDATTLSTKAGAPPRRVTFVFALAQRAGSAVATQPHLYCGRQPPAVFSSSSSHLVGCQQPEA